MDLLLSVQSNRHTAEGQLHQDLILMDRESMRDVITVGQHHTLLSDAITLLKVGQQRHQDQR